MVAWRMRSPARPLGDRAGGLELDDPVPVQSEFLEDLVGLLGEAGRGPGAGGGDVELHRVGHQLQFARPHQVIVGPHLGIGGRQEVLGLWIEETEGARFWLKIFNDLKARGVLDILVLCGDGLTGLPDAARAVFPQVDVQLCVVHQIRNATKFVSYKDRKAFCAAMRPIYTAPTIEAAELAMDRFEQSWGARYPMSVASWRNHWDGLTAFFKYPVEFRRLIYTTNAIESLHSQMRKNIASRKVFPHDDAVLKILFLNIRNFSNRWSRRQGWDIVMNQLSVIFADRLKPEIIASL